MELNEQTLREILKEQREEYELHFRQHLDESMAETRHYMGVLAEGLEHKIELIAEGHDSLRQEIREMRKQLTDLQERVTRLEGEVAGLRDIALNIQTDIRNVKSELTAIRSELGGKAGREELAALEARVGKLEKAVRSK